MNEGTLKPVAAQVRYRHPQKTMPDWSPWQPAEVDMNRPSYSVDSVGYEVEYRVLYGGFTALKEVELQEEIERLHVELAKANGACGEMSYELSSLLHDLERVEHQRDVMQHRLEQAEHQRDVFMRRLGENAAVLHHVGQLLDQLQATTPLGGAHHIVVAAQQTTREALGQVPAAECPYCGRPSGRCDLSFPHPALRNDTGGHSDAG